MAQSVLITFQVLAMRPFLPVGLSVLVIAASLPAAASVPPNRRPDLNAFVNHKVGDTSSLISQVRSDPEVADRYERHFGMNRRELVSYLATLHRGVLSKGGRYTVYSVPEGGRVKMHSEVLKKGSPMFLDAYGKPTLIVKCGNPLVLGPARVRRGNPLTVVPVDTDKTRQMSMLVPRDADSDVNPDALVALVPSLPNAVPATEEPVVTETTTTAAAVATVPVAIAAGGHAFPYAALLPLGFLGFIHSGGHDNGGAIAPVPEPTTIVVMGLGLVGIARRRRR